MALTSSRPNPDAPKTISIGDVRALEQPGKLLDATVELPEPVREAIGFEGLGPSSEVELGKHTAKSVRQQWPWSRQMHWIGTAIALSVDDVASARLLLRELPPNGEAEATEPRTEPTPFSLEGNLRLLAAGKPVADWSALEQMMVGEDASPWLIARLRYRHLSLAGDPTGARESLQESRSQATRWVNLQLVHNLTFAGLVLVGFLLLVSWPLLKRVVARARRSYLAMPPAPPFRPDSLKRVVAWWFLAHLALGVALGVLAGVAPQWFIISLVANSLLDGAVALTLMQSTARRAGDHSPITMPLRLNRLTLVGGSWSIPLWIVGGLAVCLFFTTVGFVLNLSLFGAPSETQSAIHVMERLTSPADIALAIASVCAVAPLVEEIIFRGYVYQTVRAWTGPTLAMMLSGLLFGLVHLDPANLLPLAALGAGLAFVYEWSGSLWIPIAIHGLFNLITVVRTFTLVGV